MDGGITSVIVEDLEVSGGTDLKTNEFLILNEGKLCLKCCRMAETILFICMGIGEVDDLEKFSNRSLSDTPMTFVQT